MERETMNRPSQHTRLDRLRGRDIPTRVVPRSQWDLLDEYFKTKDPRWLREALAATSKLPLKTDEEYDE